MMKIVTVIILLILFQDVAFKPADEFEVKLDYQFKTRPSSSETEVYSSDRHVGQTNSSAIPHLIVNVNVMKTGDNEVKVKVVSNKNQVGFQKKISTGTKIEIPFGFTDDVKDGVAPNEYTLTFLDKEKVQKSRIVLLIDKDGVFFVNGVKQGKF